MKALPIDEFLKRSAEGVVLDVRTPAEFEKGHIPGAHNLPLFTDEERAIVGTIYKHNGRQPAIAKGLELVGPRMKQYIRTAETLSGSSHGKLFVYCWRGGMRSGSMAWLLDMYGFEVYVLKRGYKAFRNFALESFAKPLPLVVLGGKTGSGKTEILQQMAARGETVIDLEALAHHKGSAFGTIGETENCSQEYFENKLAMQWLAAADARRVWVEDESRSIGRKILPEGVWTQMRKANVLLMEISLEQRVNYLVKIYGTVGAEVLLAATEKVKKRLGNDIYKLAVSCIENGELATAAGLLLKYYDKAYGYGLAERNHETIFKYTPASHDFNGMAGELIEFANRSNL